MLARDMQGANGSVGTEPRFVLVFFAKQTRLPREVGVTVFEGRRTFSNSGPLKPSAVNLTGTMTLLEHLLLQPEEKLSRRIHQNPHA